MHSHLWKRIGAMCLAGALALAGCSGEDGDPGATGATGAPGAPGEPGADLAATAKPESCSVCHPDAGTLHQSIYNQYTDTSTLVATIDSVVSTLNPDNTTYTSTVTFTLRKSGAAYNGDATLSGLGQKRYTATRYDPATGLFETASAITFANLTPVAGVPGQYTVSKSNAAFAPESSNAFVYFYFAEKPNLIPAKGHYNLYDNVASVARAYGTLDYVSTANVSACEKCHGAPYMKHGYRAANVAPLPNMVACKACHTDQRVGTDFDWQVLADDPRTLATFPRKADGTVDWTVAPALATAQKYPYRATIMNDTHMSHAMEFAYPQSMANCVTCHEGKLDQVLTDANFTLETCKSCHPVTGGAVADRDAKRAPPLMDIALPASYHTMDMYTSTIACNSCHNPTGIGPTFAEIHAGYDKTIYANATTKYSSTIKANIDTLSFDSATNRLTVAFSVAGVAAQAIVKPTVVISLYGYDTKDFIVGGHASQPAPDSKRNLEWTEGATGNSPRLTVAPAAAAAGVTSWTATADLTLWAGLIADGTVKKVEIGILPTLGLDQTVAPQNNPATAGYNPYIAIGGATKTFDLVGNVVVADAYGKAIVDTAKCNNCHDALGTSFHSPSYGSADVVGCRLCHVVGSGGSHLEMQSRSIDSYVHAIHSMQPFDIGDVDFTDPVAAMRYEHHIESTYPNFTILNCESCHNPGTYEVPDQSKSLPGVLSAADAVDGRSIGTVPAYVTGPGARACGSCHRTELINEDAAGQLAAFNEHTATFGYGLENGTGVLDAAIAKIMAFFK